MVRSQAVAAAGDDGPVAFERFRRRHGPTLVRAARLLGAAPGEAGEIVAQVMEEARRTWPTLADPLAWVRRTVVHRLWKSGRWERRQNPGLVGDPGPAAEILGEEAGPGNLWEDRGWTARLLERLPAAQRPVMAHVVDGLTPAEAADRLGGNAPTVRANLLRARRRLETETPCSTGRARPEPDTVAFAAPDGAEEPIHILLSAVLTLIEETGDPDDGALPPVAEEAGAACGTAATAAPSGTFAPPGTLCRFPREGGPTVLRILLGARLRRLREARGISLEEAGYEIRASHSKISRMELGRVGFKERDVADLLSLYGLEEGEERELLLQLAREARSPGWWHRYGDVLPDWFETYVGLEGAADLMRTYEVQVVPALMQTEEYASAAVRLAHPEAREEEVRRRVELKLTRQERFDAADGRRLWAVLDEAVLRRPLGGREVMRAQLRHLADMAARPDVTLQVVPFGSAENAAAGRPFTILRFAEPSMSDVVFMEYLTSALYLDKPADVDAYMRAMNTLCLAAMRPRATVDFLEHVLKEL